VAIQVPVRHAELERYRAEFPLLGRVTYLNTCSLGALSTRSRERLGEFLEQWDRLGARAWYGPWLEELERLREDYGWTIGRSGSEIALASSISAALASLASALDPIHRGDAAALDRLAGAGLPVGRSPRPRVVTSELDFPTVGHQWLARGPLGVDLVIVRSPDGLTVPVESFAEVIDERTAAVVTGHAYFTTGWVQDVEALGRLAHERGALLVLDAYQATGLVPTDLSSGAVDAYASGTLKWLFGGTGNAFLWVRPAIREALDPTTTGWFSSARQFEFDVASLDFSPIGRKFEMGTPSLPSAFIARGGMSLVREIGIPTLQERTLDLGDLLIAVATDAGLPVRPVPRERRTGIVTIAAGDPHPIVDGLAEREIIVDHRPGIVRLSPAFYNTEDEIRAVVGALADLMPA
jgi:selenocysteine lyase/cysteine desulfurase